MNEVEFRDGTAEDAEECVSLWVGACATRDGAAVVGVAERARPKFDDSECWIVAEDAFLEIVGFRLEQSVLHVLADHHTAVHLYEKMGWQPLGEPFPHSLLGRPTQAYVLDLHVPGSR